MRNLFEPLFLNLKEKAFDVAGLAKRTIQNIPDVYSEFYKGTTQEPVLKQVAQARDFLLPRPKSKEEALSMGMVQVPQIFSKDTEPLFVDVIGAVGAMRKVGPKMAKIVGAERIAMEAKALAKKGIQKAGEIGKVPKIPPESQSLAQEAKIGIEDLGNKMYFNVDGKFKATAIIEPPNKMRYGQVGGIELRVEGKNVPIKIPGMTKEMIDTPEKAQQTLGKYLLPEKKLPFPPDSGEVFPEFQGFKDLTTKVLERLKGRTTVSRQEIMDFARRPELKKGEADLLLRRLEEFESKDNIKLGGQLYKKTEFGNELYRITKVLDDKIEVMREGTDMRGIYNIDELQKEGFNTSKRQLLTTEKPYYVQYYNSKLGDDFELGRFNTKEEAQKFIETLSGVKKQNAKIGTYITGKTFEAKIPVQEFADKVKSELLPLKLNSLKPGDTISPRYENISLPDEVRGNVSNYAEHIYESPIKTSAGEVHFGRRTENYFGHTRIEDMAPSGSSDSITGLSGGLTPEYAKILKKQSKQGTIRRVIEVQSDLYQKGGLEREMPADKLMYDVKPKDLEAYTKQRNSEVQKLQQYNDPTAHFRMVREEVKQAAIDDKTKLQFPTGETAMKIEGLGEPEQFQLITNNVARGFLKPEQLKVGQEVISGQIYRGENTFIITDILGDGKFKAVPKDRLFNKSEAAPGAKFGEVNNKFFEPHDAEQFDISGKVDTNNPIYKFYEKDLGRYLKNKYNATSIIDDKGVSWMQVDIKPEHKGPVEAFGVLPFLFQDNKEEKPRIFKSYGD